ncbi:MAG: SDR family NAD(P)-dependent oxidoreductase [Dehalococcoidia bacterium]
MRWLVARSSRAAGAFGQDAREGLIMGLQGRVALITGGTSGIGLATARALAAAGAAVTIVGRRADGAELAATLGTEGRFLQADLMQPDLAADLVRRVVEERGRLDTLFCAAGFVRWGPATERTPQELDDMLTIHLRATFACCQAAIPAMAADRRRLDHHHRVDYGAEGGARLQPVGHGQGRRHQPDAGAGGRGGAAGGTRQRGAARPDRDTDVARCPLHRR